MDHQCQYLSFAHEQYQLNWSDVLCSKFGVVQGLNVWVTVTQSGPLNISISEGLLRETEYAQLLNDTLLPLVMSNQNIIYLQESSEITMSDIVRSWFAIHPQVKCITWPANNEVDYPILLPWGNMKKYVNNNFPFSRRQTKKLIFDFWKLKTPDNFKDSFATVKSCLEKVKDEHLAFVRDHLKLDWSKILFSKFGVVRCVNVWAAGTQTGPFNISMSDGLPSETRYLQILNDIVLPFFTENRDITFVQESNEIIKSDVVRSWFRLHPEIKCITWPSIVSPISQAWGNMNKFVDENFPLTGREIKGFIFDFWEIMKRESPDYYLNSFGYVKRRLENISN